MQNQSLPKNKMSTPLLAALVIGFFSAIVVGLSFEVIKFWPMPASVVPALTFEQGLWWGAIVGGLTGLILGFATDDAHFKRNN